MCEREGEGQGDGRGERVSMCVCTGHLVSETVKVKRHYQERSLISTLEEQEPRPVDRFSLATEPEM